MKEIDFYELNYELGMQKALSSDEPVIDRQIKVLKELTGREFEEKKVKQIASCRCKDIFIVYEDGKVLKNFEPYESKKVEGIFNASRDFYYVIYEDNTIGSLYSEDEVNLKGKYDKILFDENFLLALKGKELVVLARVWSGVDDDEVSVLTVYDGVSDVQLLHNWEPGSGIGDGMMETDMKIKVGDKWLTMWGTPIMHSKGKCDCAHCESKAEK